MTWLFFQDFEKVLHTQKGEGEKKKKSLVKPKRGMLEERQHASLNTSMIQQCEYKYKSPFIEIHRHYNYEHIFLCI